MASIFDKVIVGINNGINSVSEGSKNMVEKAKLNTQLQAAEDERNLVLQNIGTLVYNLHASGELSVESCKVMCYEVQRYNDQIAALQNQLQNLERGSQPGFDPHLVGSMPPEGGVRCTCGHINQVGAKFCAKCGNRLNPGAKFCGGCGNKIL